VVGKVNGDKGGRGSERGKFEGTFSASTWKNLPSYDLSQTGRVCCLKIEPRTSWRLCINANIETKWQSLYSLIAGKVHEWFII